MTETPIKRSDMFAHLWRAFPDEALAQPGMDFDDAFVWIGRTLNVLLESGAIVDDRPPHPNFPKMSNRKMFTWLEDHAGCYHLTVDCGEYKIRPEGWPDGRYLIASMNLRVCLLAICEWYWNTDTDLAGPQSLYNDTLAVMVAEQVQAWIGQAVEKVLATREEAA